MFGPFPAPQKKSLTKRSGLHTLRKLLNESPWAVQYTDLVFLRKEAMRIRTYPTLSMDVDEVYRGSVSTI